jgi:hypothetical protein
MTYQSMFFFPIFVQIGNMKELRETNEFYCSIP